MGERGGRRTGPPATIWSVKLALLRFVMVAASVLFTVLVFAQVVMRYLLDLSVYGIEELAIYAAVWLYFLGAAYGAHERAHISASLIEVLLPSEGARRWLQVAANLASVVLSAWMTVWVVRFFLWSLGQGSRSIELGIPTAWVHAAMPVGLALMTLYFVVELLDSLRLAREPAASRPRDSSQAEVGRVP